MDAYQEEMFDYRHPPPQPGTAVDQAACSPPNTAPGYSPKAAPASLPQGKVC